MPCMHCAILLAILSRLDIDVEIPLSCTAIPEVQEVSTLMSRKVVMSKLNIKDSAYTRWIEQGILVPRVLGRRHFYTDEDLVRAFEESVRKGKR